MLVKDEPSPPFACKVTIWPVLERMYFLPSYFFKSLKTLCEQTQWFDCEKGSYVCL